MKMTEEASKNARIKELSEEIRNCQEELYDITMSESERAYNSYEVAAENAKELWRSYLNTLYGDHGMIIHDEVIKRKRFCLRSSPPL